MAPFQAVDDFIQYNLNPVSMLQFLSGGCVRMMKNHSHSQTSCPFIQLLVKDGTRIRGNSATVRPQHLLLLF